MRRVDREKPALVGAPAGNRSAHAKDDGFEELCPVKSGLTEQSR